MVFSSRAGGLYFISSTAIVNLRTFSEAEKVRLTDWLVLQRRLGVECPEVQSHTLDDAAKRRSLKVQERADAILRFLVGKNDLLGTQLSFQVPGIGVPQDDLNQLLAWTGSVEASELVTLIEHCEKQGWISYTQRRRESSHEIVHKIALLPDGCSRLEALEGDSALSAQAFVAMWFDESMLEAYEQGIAKAIRNAGYDPLRIDRKEHNNKIDDEIIGEIRRSRFVVADFTQGASGARGGVYYEAGFAHGHNIPVIFTCRADALEAVHFDTRQYNHIAWRDIEDLRTRLSQRIGATIGDGPLKGRNQSL
jgi:nucleoside 2-deoxyribosyltransferase